MSVCTVLYFKCFCFEPKIQFSKMLKDVVKIITKNLDKIIDINHYPIPEAKTSILHHRPITIDVQGLADVFILLKLSFESQDACMVNLQIFETIYYGALEASCELAESKGVYGSYKGSSVSKDILQPRLSTTNCGDTE